MENVNAIIAKYLEKLDFPRCPDAIRADSTNITSTNKSEWIKSMAKIKKLTDEDSMFVFDIVLDPTNPTRNLIYLGVPYKNLSLVAIIY